MRKLYEQNYFLIRRLHSLSGIIPVGAFFLVHMLLNSRAMQSPEAYQWVPDTLDQVPFILFIELGLIILPIFFHGILGVVIVVGGDPNSHKPALNWYENHAYTLQRWTGVILSFMLIGHLWQTWWQHMMVKFGAATGDHAEFDIFGLMVGIVKNPVWLVVYFLFVLIAAFHFGNGIFNFLYKWGATTSKTSQKWAIAGGLFIGLIGLIMGTTSLWGFYFSPWARELMAKTAGMLIAGH